MFRVEIKKDNKVTNRADFESVEQAEAWIAGHKIRETFGKQAGEYSDIILNEEERASATSERIDEFNNKFLTIPDQYAYEINDVSVETAFALTLFARSKKRLFGENLIDEIAAINDSKGLTHDQVDAFMSDPIIINLKEHLWAGNIDTFIYKLENSDVSAYFTSEEKSGIILKCQNFLSSLGA